MKKNWISMFFAVGGLVPSPSPSLTPFLSNTLAPISVCSTCSVKTIREAIQAAQPGQTVVVQAGEYREGLLVIDKPIKIKGEGRPILNGENKSGLFQILNAPGTEISGFVLRDTGMSYTEEIAGIRVTKTVGCRVYDNQIERATYGIYLEDSSECEIDHNEMSGIMRGEADTGNGIHVWSGTKFHIHENRISRHRDGIYLEYTSDSKIDRNLVQGNLRYGLHFMNSNRNSFFENTFVGNGAGVAVMYSRDIEMLRNRFDHNSGIASYGLLLKEIHSSRIEDNSFSENTVGIFMEASNRSLLQKNRFAANGWALRIMGDCENNQIKNNDFIKNTFDVSTNSDRNPNQFEENFWSTYEGYDLDHDGYGDKPYRPVSLSSVVFERTDSSYILLRSFLFRLLDEIERALPVLIPASLSDDRPRMSAVGGGVLDN